MASEGLDALVEAATDAIITADDEGRVVAWNPAAARIFGYAADEIVGRPLTLLIPARYQAAHSDGLARVATGGPSRVIGRTVELSGVRRDGEEFPLELSLSTWTSDGRRFFGGIIRDITDRKKAQDDLAASEARLSAILQSASDAIVCADQCGVITMWNAAAERMLGYPEAAVLGQPLTMIIPERFHDAHNSGILRMSRGEEPRIMGTTVEVYAKASDGSEIPIELSLATWVLGETRWYSGILRDISMRKWAEAQIESANTELAEKNQQLEALSAKLAKYLSRQVYDSIFEGRTEVRVESYRKLLTVFFSDIEGFSHLTDIMEAEPLSELLNEYLREMAAIATEYDGTIDKFIGDGIMIFFGDPETRGAQEDALACADMAIAMKERIASLGTEWTRRGVQRPLRVRIGINTGYCTVGNFGSEERLDYTIVGGQVNAAARLEANASANQILVSHQTWALIKDHLDCVPVGEIKVKGIAHPLLTYEVVGRLSASETRPA